MTKMPISDFADRITEIMPIIMKEFMRHQTDEFYKSNVTLPQFAILDLLSTGGESKMTDIAKFMNVTTAAMTGIVDRLIKYNYVSRARNPKDRRVVKVKLTAKGSGVVKKLIEHRRQALINMFGKVSQKEREDYLRILTHIKEHLI